MRLCEITLKKEKAAGTGSKRPNILHRSIKVPELKGSVRLKVSTEGVQLIQSAGGLVKFVEQQDEKKLSKKLRRLKQKLLAQGIIKAPEPKKTEEEAPPAEAAEAAEAPAEESAAQAPAEEKAEEKVEEGEAEAKPEKEKVEEKKEATEEKGDG